MKREENEKERVERLLQMDIYAQACRPRSEVRKELKEAGIDASALAKKAMQMTKQVVKRAKK